MTLPSTSVLPETELVADLRAQVAQALAGHAGSGLLPAAERRRLTEQYTGEPLDTHVRQALDAGRAPLSASVEARMARAVIDHIIGAGGLQQLLDNPDIENVHANGCDEVFIKFTGGKAEVGPPIAKTDEALIGKIQALATEAAFGDDFSGRGEERAFDRTSPALDMRMRDGSRLCAVMSVSRRPALSIRRPTMINADLDDLVRPGGTARNSERAFGMCVGRACRTVGAIDKSGSVGRGAWTECGGIRLT
ncbi:hypothetical protein [Micromonospora wenchangensis]|uniref:hypothetical protein n=1 Tax=Micromonospora wenchangensis TaxID=1185415 RepID=UPI0011834F0D|nr:hypothetical protein [Micromonospora wenchangensis]